MAGEFAPESVALARVTRDMSDGRTTVVFVRDFERPYDAVWSMLTDPSKLRMWAPHTADRDLSTVGKVTFTMLGDVVDVPEAMPDIAVPGVVLVANPPYLLEHSWANDALAWMLDPIGESTRLTLRHTLSDASMASAVAAGWHLCLDVADAALTGRTTTPVRGREAMNHGWADLNERYAAQLGVEPSHIDL
jgi:uncharacterized protein YndB with AHSA1/START domain